jgi:hypothetical protein
LPRFAAAFSSGKEVHGTDFELPPQIGQDFVCKAVLIDLSPAPRSGTTLHQRSIYGIAQKEKKDQNQQA